jgi:L-lactate utilization protein LutC
MTSKVHEADTDLHTRTVAAETNFDSKYDEIATRFDARDSAASRQQAKHSQELTHAINGAVIRLQQAIWRANLDTVHRETAANAIASQSVNAALQSARRVTRASHAASDRVRLAEASVAVRLA